MWAAEGQPIIQPKSRGSGIMVSDFIDEYSGYLRLSDEEHSLAKASDSEFPKEARVLLEYGADWECYWNSDRFMENIKNAAKIAEASIQLISTQLLGILIKATATKPTLKML